VDDTDRELVEAIKAGDTDAFDRLYDTYFHRVHNFALRRLGDRGEAEDVTQEVFTAVFTCIDRFQGRSALVVWIYGIARNVLNNRFRRRGGVRLIALEDMPAEAAPRDLGPEPRAEARELLGRVRSAIESLSPDQQRILELRHAERMAIRKIAAVMERSEDAIKSSLYRTRRALVAKLPGGRIDLSF